VTDILEIYENLLNIDVDYQIIVITGRNQKLYDAFNELLHDQKEIVTDEEPELIKHLGEESILRYMYEQTENVMEHLTSIFRHTPENRKPTKLFYFIDNVDDYMHASDLIVTKPGGLTISESLACHLPMAIYNAYPGQEQYNVNFLLKQKAAISVTEENASEEITKLLHDTAKLNEMRENCKRLARPHAAEDMYKLAKDLTEPSKPGEAEA
jgi:processive 1,2-diacylglycerol beta-glucosyltransferase